MIATYVFWNHVEEEEGIFRWDGQRDLRRFLEVCKAAEMPVVLRIGPWCHGEVRNGGFPDWLFRKNCKLRSQDPVFLSYVAKLYRQIYVFSSCCSSSERLSLESLHEPENTPNTSGTRSPR